MGPKTTLTTVEELKLVDYMLEMQNLAHPLSVTNLKLKVAEICQGRVILLKDGILGKSWLKWSIVHGFKNLQKEYNQQEFQPTYKFWNVDEFEANASRSGHGKVLASRGSRNVHTIIPNEREWISSSYLHQCKWR